MRFIIRNKQQEATSLTVCQETIHYNPISQVSKLLMPSEVKLASEFIKGHPKRSAGTASAQSSDDQKHFLKVHP